MSGRKYRTGTPKLSERESKSTVEGHRTIVDFQIGKYEVPTLVERCVHVIVDRIEDVVDLEGLEETLVFLILKEILRRGKLNFRICLLLKNCGHERIVHWMAQSEEDEDLQVVSALPPPPAYYKILEKESQTLTPPAIVNGEYMSFGTLYNIEEEQLFPKIFPDKALDTAQEEVGFNPMNSVDHLEPLVDSKSVDNFKMIFEKLAKSIMSKYLDVCNAMTNKPSAQREMSNQLENLIINFHDLVNKYRTVQAYVRLTNYMEKQNAQLIESIRNIKTLMKETYVRIESIASPPKILEAAHNEPHQTKVMTVEDEAAGNDPSPMIIDDSIKPPASMDTVPTIPEPDAREEANGLEVQNSHSESNGTIDNI